MKFYHASPHRFKPGDLIGSHDTPVFMTGAQMPHYTIHAQAVKENWYVYRVRPLYKVNPGHVWDEAWTVMAEVVRCVAAARGIDRNRKKHWKKKVGWKGEARGSDINWKIWHNVKGNQSTKK